MVVESEEAGQRKLEPSRGKWIRSVVAVLALVLVPSALTFLGAVSYYAKVRVEDQALSATVNWVQLQGLLMHLNAGNADQAKQTTEQMISSEKSIVQGSLSSPVMRAKKRDEILSILKRHSLDMETSSFRDGSRTQASRQ